MTADKNYRFLWLKVFGIFKCNFGISLLSCNIALKSFLSSFAISATYYFKDNLFGIPMQ